MSHVIRPLEISCDRLLYKHVIGALDSSGAKYHCREYNVSRTYGILLTLAPPGGKYTVDEKPYPIALIYPGPIFSGKPHLMLRRD